MLYYTVTASKVLKLKETIYVHFIEFSVSFFSIINFFFIGHIIWKSKADEQWTGQTWPNSSYFYAQVST